MISLDTNILVYAVDENSGERHQHAANLVRNARDAPVALTEQAIFEFVNVVTRKAKLTLDRALPYVQELLTTFTLICPSDAIVNDVFALIEAHNLNVFDARILAVCGAHGCDHLLSEDLQDGAQYGAVRIVNPFNTANASLVEQLLS